MTLAHKVRLDPTIELAIDNSVKTNPTKLKAKPDRAIVTHIKTDILLPDDTILTVDISFDNDSSFNNNALLIMDDFAAELVADSFALRYGDQAAQLVREKWYNKEDDGDPRKPTFMFVKTPAESNQRPGILVSCGKTNHDGSSSTY